MVNKSTRWWFGVTAPPDDPLLREAMSRLSDREAAVTIGRFVERKTLQHVAVELQISPQGVHRLERAALAKLRRYFGIDIGAR